MHTALFIYTCALPTVTVLTKPSILTGVEGGPEVVFGMLPACLCALFSSSTVTMEHDSVTALLREEVMGC